MPIEAKYRQRPLVGLSSVFLTFSSLSVQAEAEEPAEPLVLPPISVVGEPIDRPSYYTSEDAGAATKTGTPVMETPQSVRSVSQQLLEDAGATRFDAALDFASGVNRQNDFGGVWDNFAIRGFTGDEDTGPDFLRNGFSANRGFNAPRDTANVERIEFLKGPSAALYGRSEPGGTVNIVTKVPLWMPAQTISLSAGSYDSYRATADLTGPLSEDWAYRLNVAAEDKGSFRDFVNSERQLLAPSLAWENGDTSVNYDLEYLRQEAPFDRGVVAIDGELGAVPISRFLGEPNDGDITIENLTHQLRVEQILNTRWSTRLGIGYRTTSLEGYATEAHSWQPGEEGRILRRMRRFRDFESEDLSGQAELLGRFGSDAMTHTLLVGVEAYRLELDTLILRANPSEANPYAIDIFNPVYGQTPPTLQPNLDTSERQSNRAIYVQDEVSLGRQWRVLLGARFDHFEQRIDNHRSGTTRHQEQDAVSPRAGIVYLPTPGLSVYANAAESFRPNSGLSFRPDAGSDAQGEGFDPERGRSFELGVKTEWLDGRLGATLALFHIQKRNVLTADPANPDFSIAAGEVESRGLEVDVAGQLTPNWRVNLAYAYIDAEVTEDNTLPVGTRLANIPKHSGSLFTVYEFSAERGRVGLGGGLVYVGERAGDSWGSGFELPESTVTNLLAYYQPDRHLTLSLNVHNLFDEEYYTSSYWRFWVAPGAPRTVTATAEYTF